MSAITHMQDAIQLSEAERLEVADEADVRDDSQQCANIDQPEPRTGLLDEDQSIKLEPFSQPGSESAKER